MAGFRCPAPMCNDKPDRSELEHAILQDQRQMLAERFVGKRMRWATAEKRIVRGMGKRGAYVRRRPLENGLGIVRDVKIHHGQIFYHFEDRSEGVKRARLDSWEVQNA